MFGCQVIIFFFFQILYCLMIFFSFTNPDEMQHYVAFYLGLHSCKSTRLGVPKIQRVKVSHTMHPYVLLSTGFIT